MWSKALPLTLLSVCSGAAAAAAGPALRPEGAQAVVLGVGVDVHGEPRAASVLRRDSSLLQSDNPKKSAFSPMPDPPGMSTTSPPGTPDGASFLGPGVCAGHGFSADQCAFMGICKYDTETGSCKSILPPGVKALPLAGISGAQLCEGHSFSREQCNLFKDCCNFDSEACVSRMGNGPCVLGSLGLPNLCGDGPAVPGVPDVAKSDLAKADVAKADVAKQDLPKTELPKTDLPVR